MPPAPIQRRLRDLINRVPAVAMVVNVRKGIILSNNPAAVGKYGPIVSSNNPIDLRGVEPGEDYGTLRLVRSEEKFTVEVGEEGEFEFCSHSSTVGVLMETNEHSAQQGAQLVPDAAQYPGFHFSYLHKVLNDQRIHPDPALLKQLKLISSTKEAAKLKWRDLILEEDRDAYDKAVATAIEHGNNQRIRYRIRAIDGKEHEVTDCFGVVREEGMWPMLAGSIISTGGSAHKMQQVERLCLVGRLVGGMIHDFRNLLGGMQNMLEWCMAQSPDDSPVYKAINKTIGYTDQANGLIRCTLHLLDGKSDEDKEWIAIQELLNDVEGLIRHFGRAKTRIRVSCEKGLPPLHGQRSMLLDMILNLGLNACDAMQDQGDLLEFQAIKKRIVDKRGDSRDFICLRVVDNGCGMAPEQAQSIFDEFYTTKEDGAGLGLWMVKEAAHAFDGTVQVHSKLGEGATFEVQLPIPEDVEPEKPEAEPTESTGRLGTRELDFAQGKTVLFIEDEPLLRNGVQTWLESMGFQVHVAADGATGMELFEMHKEEIDIIVQDFILPGIRGEVLLEHFAATSPHIPVIVCSGYPDGRDHDWIIQKGAKTFLPKPFRIEKLVESLRTHLVDEQSECDVPEQSTFLRQ